MTREIFMYSYMITILSRVWTISIGHRLTIVARAAAAPWPLRRGRAASVTRARRRSEKELAAVGERHLARVPPVAAVAGAPAGDCDGIADFHRDVLLPAGPVEGVRRISFELP